MRANLGQHKKALAARAEYDLPRLLVGYEPTNLGHLGRICECICQIDEFLHSLHGKPAAAKNAEVATFLRTQYRTLIVLVLGSQSQSFHYTLHDVARFVRGESIHGASDNRDKRRELLHSFVFETTKNVQWLFIHSWNWIAGPNIGAAEGNHDSNGPFVHSITLNDRRIEVGLAESIVLRGAYEFWQAMTRGSPRETTKVFVKFDPMQYEALFGSQLAKRLHEQLLSLGMSQEMRPRFPLRALVPPSPQPSPAGGEGENRLESGERQ